MRTVPAASTCSLVFRPWKTLGKGLEDLNAGRDVLTKSDYQARVRSIMHSKRSKKAAANIAKGLRKVCKECVASGGNATQGSTEEQWLGFLLYTSPCPPTS